MNNCLSLFFFFLNIYDCFQFQPAPSGQQPPQIQQHMLAQPPPPIQHMLLSQAPPTVSQGQTQQVLGLFQQPPPQSPQQTQQQVSSLLRNVYSCFTDFMASMFSHIIFNLQWSFIELIYHSHFSFTATLCSSRPSSYSPTSSNDKCPAAVPVTTSAISASPKAAAAPDHASPTPSSPSATTASSSQFS